MTVAGGLALQSGATYIVMVNPVTSSFAHVTGTATLGGAAVDAIYTGGSSYISKQYTILNAGSVSGTFSSLVNSNLPSGFAISLGYDPTHAYLNVRSLTPSARSIAAPMLVITGQNVTWMADAISFGDKHALRNEEFISP